ncbi:hypothetical protein J5X84_38280 [Streptosporangiaceae bacterium NEAU-GS5]|nr:hypothetical protein [Streptosporangiaceae bacterium NEAU-GS5]
MRRHPRTSNNPYHLSTPRHLGCRFALDTGRLGGIVLKRPAGAPPPVLLPRLRRELRQGDAGQTSEAVLLDLPIVREIRPGALQG